ncbi:hypothetical protein O181_000532 [Austropuccinia psidii MF-1]|uniref:Uncharacterized protein n=1 Tax=Austropuccinia psidii MF-1 TaxID=1389203 RepID=A0A9Q3B926_9BASI|nr:hypothetical protein [Austropuccinia psidii MF-1]
MNWLPHHPLLISTSGKWLSLGQDMLPLPPTHLRNHPSLGFHTLMICLQPRHGISSLTHPYAFTPPPCPNYMPLMLPLMLSHPHLIFSTAYYAHTPAALSQYSSDTATPCPPSPILMLLHPCRLPCLQRFHPMSAPTHPYASAPLLLTMLTLP